MLGPVQISVLVHGGAASDHVEMSPGGGGGTPPVGGGGGIKCPSCWCSRMISKLFSSQSLHCIMLLNY